LSSGSTAHGHRPVNARLAHRLLDLLLAEIPRIGTTTFLARTL
jgi:hypothetical protein